MSLDSVATVGTATDDIRHYRHHHRHHHHHHLHHHGKRHRRPPPPPSSRRPPPETFDSAEVATRDTSDAEAAAYHHPVKYTGSVAVNCHDQMARVEFVRNLMAKHRKRMHYHKYDECVEVCNSKLQLKRSGSTSGDNTSEIGVKKQITLDTWGSRKDFIVTQQTLDSHILQFVIEEMQPKSIVDKPSFQNLVSLGLPKNVSVMCAKTLRSRIEKAGQSMQEELIKKLSGIQFIATTADCWTRGKKIYLGITGHWINVTTLERESATLACKRLKGKHTYNLLAQSMHDVYLSLKIQNKVVCTTTDNGSNFVKAFKTYHTLTNLEDNELEDEYDNELEFIDLTEILEEGENNLEETQETIIHLPRHFRCASHTMNLIATSDIDAYFVDKNQINKNNPSFQSLKRLYRKVMANLSKLWSKQNQSTITAEHIHNTLGVYFKVPNKTRWNSLFDALIQIKNLIASHGIAKFHDIMDFCALNRLNQEDVQLINEYCDTMNPLACALGFLQSESGMYMGYLLPTLYSLKKKYSVLEDKSLQYCLPIVICISTSITKRFNNIWFDKSLVIASALIPRFKLQWLTNIEQFSVEAWLKAEFKNEDNENSDATQNENEEYTDKVQIEKEVSLLITVSGIKVCSPDGKEVLMAHGLRRVSYATCDPGCKQFCFLARQPGGHINKQYCHLFVTKTAEQAEGLNSIVGNAFRMAYAAQLELERRSVTNSPKNLNNTSWMKLNDKLNVQRIHNGSPLSKKLIETPKPTPPTTLPGVRPFDHGKGLDLTPGQFSTPTSSDDSPDLNTYKRMLEKPPLIKRLAMGLSVHNNCSNEDWYPLVCSSSVSSSPSTNSDDCSTPESSQEKLKDNRLTQCSARSPDSPTNIKLKNNLISNGMDKTPTPPPLPERSDSLLNKPEECELKKAPWFQAGIPREITLEVLGQEPVGAFMVRESTTKPGCFALSLRVPQEFHPLGIAHYLILRTNKGFKIKGFTKEFTTLTALITHHSVMPELLPCPLSLSRYNPTFVKSDSNQDFADIDADPDYNTLADFRKMMADLNV